MFSKLRFNAHRRFLYLVGVMALLGDAYSQTPGVTEDTIRLGSTLGLRGDASTALIHYRDGIVKGMDIYAIDGRKIVYETRDDSYEPEKTIHEVNDLLSDGLFFMLGSFGSATTAAVLPILRAQGVPMVGFYTGTTLLSEDDPLVLNYRPRYQKETRLATLAAINAGLTPQEICIFAQNDAYGMEAMRGVIDVFNDFPAMAETAALLEDLILMTGDNPARNYIGPAGFYQRNTLNIKEGFDSLKAWEKYSGTACRFIITATMPTVTEKFVGYVHYRQEPWIISALSASTDANLAVSMSSVGVTEGVVLTQVVPPLDSNLPLITEARKQAGVGVELDHYFLEGFIVGRLVNKIFNSMSGQEITRKNFLQVARSQPWNVGGLDVNFTDHSQSPIYFEYFDNGTLRAINQAELTAIINDD